MEDFIVCLNAVFPIFMVMALGYIARLTGIVKKEEVSRLSALAFNVFRSEKNFPLLFHCIGGTDRTGTFAFLLNALLGVDEEELVRDYEMSFLSNAGMDELHAKWLDGLIKAVHEMPGDTLADKAKGYFISLGFSEEAVEQVREFLLEPAAR